MPRVLRRVLGVVWFILVFAPSGLAVSATAQTWQRTWLHDPAAPEAEAMLARLADAPSGPAALLLVAATEAEWGQRAARVWAHSGFTVLLILRPPPQPSVLPRTVADRAQPPPLSGGPTDELPRWEARLRAHPWALEQAQPLWLVTRETLPEVAALALAGRLPARELVALDGPPRLRPNTPTAEANPSLQTPPAHESESNLLPGHWWSPAWSAGSDAQYPPLATLRSLGWMNHTFPAGSPDDAFDIAVRLGRARIAADTLRAAATTGNAPARPSPADALEPLPTLHLTLRRVLALICALALGLALWAAWRGWRTTRPGLIRGSLALLGGALWLLAAGLTVARGLGPELPLELATRLGLAPASLAGEPDSVAPAERARVTLAEAQDRQRLVRLVLTHWTAYLPTAPAHTAEWCALVADPIVGPPEAPAEQTQTPSPERPETRWRRALWDNLYPSILQVATPTQAARRAAWHLRLQVRLDAPSAGPLADTAAPARWFDAWRTRQMTPAQFEYLLVAGLRSVGLPARLRPDGRAEHSSGSDWQLVWFDEGASAASDGTPAPPAP